MKAVEGGPTPGLRLFSYRSPTGCGESNGDLSG
jgi:hypothetical protein